MNISKIKPKVKENIFSFQIRGRFIANLVMLVPMS